MEHAEIRKEMMEHAWRYFELHASQRMSLFNFFLVLAGLVAAGVATGLQGSPPFQLSGGVLGIFLALASFVFAKLDQRVSFLMKESEEVMAELEVGFSLDRARLFSGEPKRTEAAAKTENWISRVWTYGSAFRFVFWLTGLVGIVGSVVCFSRFAGLIK